MSDGITITINAATEEAAVKLKQFFNGINQAAGSLADFFDGFGEKLAAAFTLGALIEEFKHAVDTAEEFGKAVEKTGLSVRALNALKILGEENRIPFEELTMALAMFNDKIFLAARMGGDAARVFRDLSISIKDDHGALLPTEKILEQVMNRFSQMPAGIQKTAAAMELFGRSGREMIPIINEGSAAFERMKAEGGGINEEDIRLSREFNAALVELRTNFDTIVRRLVVDVLPALKEFVQYLKDGVLAIELGRFADYFDLSMKAAIQDVSNFFSQEIAKWSMQMDGMMDKAKTGGFWSKTGNAIAGMGTGLLSLWDLAGAKLGIPGAAAKAEERVDQTNEFFKKAGIADGILNRAADAFVAGTKGLPNEYKDALEKFRSQMHEQVSKGALNKNEAEASGSGQGAADSAKFPGGEEIISDTAKKLIKEIDDAWLQETQSKAALLDKQLADQLKELQAELGNTQKFEQEKAKAEETTARKKQELFDKAFDEENKRRLEGIQADIERVEKNPDLTAVERKQQLLPLLDQEKNLLQQILAIEQARAGDPKRNQEEQDRAKNSIAQLQRQIAGVDEKSSLESQSPFQKVLTGLRQQNDLQQQVADSFKSIFERSISSVSNGITGLIMGTQKWSQALRQIGDQILTSIVGAIVEMGVRWVATQIMMALFGKATAAASTAALIPVAEAQSAIWATPAILADIASYGGASEQAPIDLGIAIAAGQALSDISGFATGGIVPGGEQFIRVNEAGTESVLNARATSFLGRDFINAINTGAFSNLSGRIASSLTRPATSDPFFQEQARAAAAGGGGAGGVNVQGHKLTAIITKSPQETLDALKSAEGERIILNAVKRRRLDIGLNT